MINLKIGGIIVAAFIAGAFVASDELRAYAANTIGSSDIIDESILSQDIKNGEVRKDDIATNAVTNSKIASSSISNSKVANDAITTSKIVDGGVRTADIANGNITGSKLAKESVDATKLGINSVSGLAHVMDGTISGNDIMDGSVRAADLAGDSVGGSELQGVTLLAFGQCPINPPEIDGTDDSGNGREVIFTACALPAGTERVIAIPPVGLAAGLVACGSQPSGATPPMLMVCIQNVFDQTNVDDSSQTWQWLAFKTGSG
jgi:hypothetical protein